MPCCLGLVLLGFPRLAILSLVLTSDYIGDAFRQVGSPIFGPLLGLIFLPWTTLAFAWCKHSEYGELVLWQWAFLALTLWADIATARGREPGREYHLQ